MLRVKDLIKQLEMQPSDAPVIIVTDGNGAFGIDQDYIGLVSSAYFGNDDDSQEQFGDESLFLRIALIE